MNEAVAHIAHQRAAPQQQHVGWRCLALEAVKWARSIVRRHMLQSSWVHLQSLDSFQEIKIGWAAGRARTCGGYILGP